MSTPLEHDYICLSETSSVERSSDKIPSSSSSSSSSTHPSEDKTTRTSLNLKETELRLGLPGSQSPERKVSLFCKDLESKERSNGFAVSPLKNLMSGAKRGFSDAIDGPNGKWVFPMNGKSDVELAKGAILASSRAVLEGKNKLPSMREVGGLPQSPNPVQDKNILVPSANEHSNAPASKYVYHQTCLLFLMKLQVEVSIGMVLILVLLSALILSSVVDSNSVLHTADVTTMFEANIKLASDYLHFNPLTLSFLKAQVVGWPPIRSFRKNTMASNSAKNSEDAAGCLYVKVSMDGAPYLRKVDLKTYKTYMEISSALEKMFTCFTLGHCSSNGLAVRDGLSESRLMDLLHGSEYVLTYEDKDGDWMLVGDVPWEMFIDSCKRLRIVKGSEAIGLGIWFRSSLFLDQLFRCILMVDIDDFMNS
ncbi:hypothetical protein Gogos_019101 [Gossypium gossypioides]|uniref:Auxin-responsive protein n=1 Tax=Gossypium gossypioides TaxID=34282 RepID=A0A7J9BGC4_GOSGO|nr:hypothetical protein [Gossypium gossypioides]